MQDLKDVNVVETTERIELSPVIKSESAARKHDGTVQLTSDRGVILIPTPSTDPRDPLNIPLWQKLVILGTTCLCESHNNTSEVTHTFSNT